jgi:hypothetical protein
MKTYGKFINKLDWHQSMEQASEFEQRWNNKIEEIKGLTLDGKACMSCLNDFEVEHLLIDLPGTTDKKINFQKFVQLSTDLHLALQIAFNRYNAEMKKNSFWYRLSGSIRNITIHIFPRHR